MTATVTVGGCTVDHRKREANTDADMRIGR